MQTLNRLALSAYGMHIADQIALVSVPLVAALVFEASPQIIGLLVACQALGHLLGSLPFGLIVDRAEARKTVMAASLLSALGFAGATASVVLTSLTWFAVTVTLAGFGIVLFVLASFSILPRIAGADRIAGANARIEIPRAVASFAVPLIVALVMTQSLAVAVVATASLAALTAFAFARGLPTFPQQPAKGRRPLTMILEGGRFVVRHDLLRAISLCAILWNLAFAALLTLTIPLLVEVYRMPPGTFAGALSAFGAAAILGSWVAGRFSRAVSPNVILLFGPGSSVLAAGALLAIPAGGSTLAVYAAFLLLGFGPSMWLIAQNSVRQLVTPVAQLGRVNAVIQTAVYGARPLGALLGGGLAEAASPRSALLLVVLIYLGSFAAALFSRLRGIRHYADLKASGAA
ncbi:MAG: MFS transporter [Rhodospirillales bacterium]